MPVANQLTNQAVKAASLDPRKIPFGKIFNPHFFVADYADGKWGEGKVATLESFSLHPGTLTLHYAQEIFEGLKAFVQPDGGVALFRPGMNARRFQASADRMQMPRVEESVFIGAIQQLVRADFEYIPRYPGSLYVRPVMFGTQPYIGVASSHEFVFCVITLPAGTYFPDLQAGAGAVTVLLCETVVRASRGGTGNIKAGANYAITLQVTSRAAGRGCSQVLFLDSTPGQRVEELGGMNVLFVEDGRLVTPPLNDTILPGVTRDSVLVLAQEMGLIVREYAYPLAELVDGIRSGRITEAMTCGTAAVVTGIRSFQREDGSALPVGEGKAPGPIASALFEKLQGIQYGRLPDGHGWLLHVDGVQVP